MGMAVVVAACAAMCAVLLWDRASPDLRLRLVTRQLDASGMDGTRVVCGDVVVVAGADGVRLARASLDPTWPPFAAVRVTAPGPAGALAVELDEAGRLRALRIDGVDGASDRVRLAWRPPAGAATAALRAEGLLGLAEGELGRAADGARYVGQLPTRGLLLRVALALGALVGLSVPVLLAHAAPSPRQHAGLPGGGLAAPVAAAVATVGAVFMQRAWLRFGGDAMDSLPRVGESLWEFWLGDAGRWALLWRPVAWLATAAAGPGAVMALHLALAVVLVVALGAAGARAGWAMAIALPATAMTHEMLLLTMLDYRHYAVPLALLALALSARAPALQLLLLGAAAFEDVLLLPALVGWALVTASVPGRRALAGVALAWSAPIAVAALAASAPVLRAPVLDGPPELRPLVLLGAVATLGFLFGPREERPLLGACVGATGGVGAILALGMLAADARYLLPAHLLALFAAATTLGNALGRGPRGAPVAAAAVLVLLGAGLVGASPGPMRAVLMGMAVVDLARAAAGLRGVALRRAGMVVVSLLGVRMVVERGASLDAGEEAWLRVHGADLVASLRALRAGPVVVAPAKMLLNAVPDPMELLPEGRMVLRVEEPVGGVLIPWDGAGCRQRGPW